MAGADAGDDDQWLYGNDLEGEEQVGGAGSHLGNDSLQDGSGIGEGGVQKANKSGAYAGQFGQSILDDEWQDMDVGALQNGSDVKGEMSEAREETPAENDSSSDSDSDDVQIHIGEIKTAPYLQSFPAPPKSAQTPQGGEAAATQSKLNLDTVGQVDGVSIYDYDVEAADKPWRQPGADITDYFNYGFNEELWKVFCEKQRKMKVEVGQLSRIIQPPPPPVPLPPPPHHPNMVDSLKSIPTVGINHLPPPMPPINMPNHQRPDGLQTPGTPPHMEDQHMGGRSTPEMDYGNPMRPPMVPPGGKPPLLPGMRPPMGPIGGDVPFLGPNLMPPFGVVPGPDGLHRPPFPGMPLPPHMGGGGGGPEDSLLPHPDFLHGGPMGGPPMPPFVPHPGMWGDPSIGPGPAEMHPMMGKSMPPAAEFVPIQRRDSRRSERRRSPSTESSRGSDSDRGRRSSRRKEERKESSRSSRRERRRRTRSHSSSRSRSRSRERPRRHVHRRERDSRRERDRERDRERERERDRDRDRDRERDRDRDRERKEKHHEEREKRHESRRRNRSRSRSRSPEHSRSSKEAKERRKEMEQELTEAPLQSVDGEESKTAAPSNA